MEAADKADLKALAEHYGGGADTSSSPVVMSACSSMVCMSSTGRGALREELLGSVSAEIVRDSPQPVVLVATDPATE